MTRYTSTCPLAERGCMFLTTSEDEYVAAGLVEAHMRTGGRFTGREPVLPSEHIDLYVERQNRILNRSLRERLADPFGHAGIPVVAG